MWRFLKKLEIELPYHPEIPLLGLHTDACRLSLVAACGGYSLVAKHGLTVVASLAAERRLQGMRALVVAAPWLISCGMWA